MAQNVALAGLSLLLFLQIGFSYKLSTTPGPTDPKASFCTDRADGLYPNPSNNATFFQCSNGNTYIQPCRSGLVYEDACKCCNWPNGSPVQPNTTPGTTDPNASFCTGRPDGLYVNPSNSATFFQCSNGNTYIQPCPAGLVYDDTCKCCNWPNGSPVQPTTTPGTTDPNASFCTGRPDGLYVNPSNSATFFQCSNGNTYIQPCPAGLVYDDTCKCCNWPNGFPHQPNTTPGPTDPNASFCTGRPDGLYPNPSNSATFYQCSNGNTYIQPCPAGLVYDDTCKCCNWPNGSPVQPNTTPGTTDPNASFCTGRPDGLYVNPSNSATFFQCSNGNTYIQPCPAGLVYDDTCKCCNWPNGSPVQPNTTPGTTDPNTSFCTGRPDGLYVNPSNSATFFQCSNGNTYIQPCPAGLVYDDTCKCCNWPNGSPVQPNTTPGPTDPNASFCTGRPDGLYPNPSNSATFFQCSHGITYLQPCPSGLVYDDACKCCNWPSPTEPSASFCTGRPDGLYPNPSNSATFFQCSNGNTYIQPCPAGLVYDDTCKCCNWPNGSPVQPNTTPGTTDPNASFCTGRPDGLYPNPSNSATFFQCSHGITYLQLCPSGLVYDDACKCCNWPSPTDPNASFCTGRPDGLYPNPSNSATFFQCSNGNTYIQPCQQGLVYDDTCKCCNWPNGSPVQPNTTPGPTDPNASFCTGRPDGLYPNPSNSATFFQCSHGITYLQPCPSGLVYDDACKCCNWPSPTDPNASFCTGRPDGLYSNPSNSATFFQCSNGNTYIQHCQQGLVYDNACKCCNWP